MALSQKQREAVARAPKAKRSAMIEGFLKQQAAGRARNTRPSGGRRLAQGVGSVPRRAFGSTAGNTLAVWDATHPSHLPLPRSVGPYTVIRTTKRMQDSKNVLFIGAFMSEATTTATNRWTNVCAVSDVVAANPINGAANTSVHCMDLSGLGSAATVVPSAITVQIMNPDALQTTSGISYIGVMKTQADWGGSTDTWTTKANQFVQFMAPRLCSAGKLALRGVKVNSYPLNMTACSDFQEIQTLSDGDMTWTNDVISPTGWAPIVIYNPGGAALELLITIEWRVRFDISNVAASTHIHHPCATDSQWDRLMRAASSMGHGVREISETVAAAGAAAEGIGRIAALAAV